MTNLDVIGAAAVGVGASLVVTLLSVKAAGKGSILAILLGGWALTLATLAMAGVFSYPGGIGTPAIGVRWPLLVGRAVRTRSSSRAAISASESNVS